MNINGLLKTEDFRGDHGSDITIAINVTPETTVRELVESVEKYQNPTKFNNGLAHIELRLIKDVE